MNLPKNPIFYQRRLRRLGNTLTIQAAILEKDGLAPFWIERAQRLVARAWRGVTDLSIEVGRRVDFMTAIDTVARIEPRADAHAADAIDRFVTNDDPDLAGRFDLANVRLLLDAWVAPEPIRGTRATKPKRKWSLISDVWCTATTETVSAASFRKEWQRELKRQSERAAELKADQEAWARAQNPDAK